MFDVGVASLAILFYTSANNEAGNLTWPTNCKGPLAFNWYCVESSGRSSIKLLALWGKLKATVPLELIDSLLSDSQPRCINKRFITLNK
jgi:hypothetical protein